MANGYVVNRTDGVSVIVSERKYREFIIPAEKAGGFIESIIPYIDMQEAIREYPWLEVFE
ncbi:hypothetical protein [Oceanobacillus profundus]|uniref:Uncharacterized protein n=1 Tax=Oceanobacillus profundus TaxID=372463 RepID=A0A417YGK6_9BACI|nr:hypothetical protein [Oceanobacillus profundus]RHW31876.1 hypothetical protein D1B32_11600 [Oceanobacillus profundus]